MKTDVFFVGNPRYYDLRAVDDVGEDEVGLFLAQPSADMLVHSEEKNDVVVVAENRRELAAPQVHGVESTFDV